MTFGIWALSMKRAVDQSRVGEKCEDVYSKAATLVSIPAKINN